MVQWSPLQVFNLKQLSQGLSDGSTTPAHGSLVPRGLGVEAAPTAPAEEGRKETRCVHAAEYHSA